MDVATRMRRVRAAIGVFAGLFVVVASLAGGSPATFLPLPVSLLLVLLLLTAGNAVSVAGERRGWPRTTEAELAVDAVTAVAMVQLGAGVTSVVLIPPILILVVFEAAARRHRVGGAVVGLVLGVTISALRLAGLPPTAVPPDFGWPNALSMVLLLPFGGWVLGTTFASRDRIAADLRRVNEELEERTRQVVRVNAELGATNEQLAEVNRELDHFAAVVAHDLKSPLSSMLGFAGLLRGAGVPAPADGYVDRILDSGERAVAMIDAMLAHARSVLAATTLRTVALADVVGAALADLDDEVADRAAVIEVDAPHEVWSDPTLLRVVVQNLLANALRYHAADVPLRVRVRSASIDGGRVALDVEDAGVGIPVEDRERVFELGARLGAVDEPGTGLGLATVRTLVRRLGGDISVTDSPLGGTTVRVQLPSAPSDGGGSA